MKTNYYILGFTFIINLFMAFSLNTFSTSALYLPALFLYFLSNLAAFIDKYTYYKDLNYIAEKNVSLICFLLSLFMVILYIADSLHYIEFMFHFVNGHYSIIIQSAQDSFFTFNSIDTTLFILASAFFMPFAYLLFCCIAFLREKGFNYSKIKTIIDMHSKKFVAIPIISLLSGCIGDFICYRKYKLCYAGYGNPQYFTYFVFFSIGMGLFSFIILLFFYNTDTSQSL